MESITTILSHIISRDFRRIYQQHNPFNCVFNRLDSISIREYYKTYHNLQVSKNLTFIFVIYKTQTFEHFRQIKQIPDFGLPPQTGLPVDQDPHPVHHVNHLQGDDQAHLLQPHHDADHLAGLLRVPRARPPPTRHPTGLLDSSLSHKK